MSFSDTLVLLTGVGHEGQVGEVVARTLAERGASLVLVDRRLEVSQARAATLTAAGHRAAAYGCDLSNADEVAALATRVRAEHGDKLGALVSAAGGFSPFGPIADSDPGAWQRLLAINLTTAYLVTRSFLPLLRAAHGAVVYFASEATLPGTRVAEISAYAAAKSGVVALMRAVAQEEQKNGVRANAVAPTAIRTAANLESMGNDMRYVEREEVAAVVAFLCSTEASAITGQIIRLS
jgi:NAD(P)-dependent dehydrogenase (short-subunit alcohol dehydrogenase family)